MTHKLDSRMLDLLTILHVAGYNAVVCGGAARDAYHMREPKDYDICLLDTGEYVWQTKVLALLRGAGIGAVERDCSLLPYDGEEDTRLDFVIHGEYKDLKFDILQYSDPKQTIAQQLAAFDCTLNMAWFDPENGEVCVSSQFPATENAQIFPLDRHIEADRVEYLEGKYPQYDFSPMKALY